MHFVVQFISILFELLSFAILARILFSWLGPQHRSGRIYMVLVDITDPILKPLAQVIPPIGMIDISPLVALIGLDILQRLIISLLI